MDALQNNFNRFKLCTPMTPIGQKRVKQVNLQNSVFVNITAIFTASFFIKLWSAIYNCRELYIYMAFKEYYFIYTTI